MLAVPTPIVDQENLIPVSTPYHIKTTYSNFTHVMLSLWVWTGELTSIYYDDVPPNIILYKQKVSTTDTYVIFELDEYIKSYITPTFNYRADTVPTISDEGVYVQFQVDFFLNPSGPEATPIHRQTYSTKFATLGYNWNFEGQLELSDTPSFGPVSTVTGAHYDSKIRYINRSFNLSEDIEETSAVLSVSQFVPTTNLKCAKEPYLIVFLNKLGLFEYFQPYGKITISDAIKREDYTRTFRDPTTFSNSITHQVKQYNLDVKQSWVINTGLINESLGQKVEEILYSPMVYLIEFFDFRGTVSGYYNYFRQIPVIVTDTDFTRKTRLNDKSKISYNIKFEETTSKVRNIR